jgi:ABC-type multidrug transport system fused ATPase/permease subunit
MRFRAIVKGYRLQLFVRLVAIGLGQAVIVVSTVLLVRLAFDRLIAASPSASFPLMMWVGLGLVAAAFCMSWLRMLERIDSERMGQDYTHRIRIRLFDHLSALAPRALQKRSRGAIVLRFVGDLNALKRWVSLGLARVTVAGTTAAGALLALSIVNWVLALGVSTVLAGGTIYILGLGKQLRETVKESRRRRSYLAANVNEKVASMAVVQVFGQSARERRRIGRQSNRLKNAMVARARKIGLMRAVTHSTTALASGTVLLLGANQVASGLATPGTVVAAMTIVGLLVPALRDLGRVYEYWHDAQVSSKKIRQFIKTPTLVNEMADAPDLKPGQGRLEFVDVSLSGAVNGVRAIAEPDAVVALLGPNGAGKSTLLSLAARLIDPDDGKIVLDDQDLAKHSLTSVRRAIGMVSSDLPLLRGTIDKNLRYRWPDAPVEEIERVKALCEIDKVLAELPAGEQTRVREGGSNLSLGQRQRIALGRALLGNPSILLLDEADAHLDHESIALLVRILAEYRGTVLLVTHNVDLLAAADFIWRMEDGQLVEVVAPADLSEEVTYIQACEA